MCVCVCVRERESGVVMTGMGWRVQLSFVNGSVFVVLPIPDQTFGTQYVLRSMAV